MTYKSFMKKDVDVILTILEKHHPKFGFVFQKWNNRAIRMRLCDFKRYLLRTNEFLELKIVEPLIRETFAKITDESAENGDYSETGWINKEGVTFFRKDPDYLIEALQHLLNNGALEKSNSSFSIGTWYTNSDWNTDIHTNEREKRSYHLVGFTEEEQKLIYNGMGNGKL